MIKITLFYSPQARLQCARPPTRRSWGRQRTEWEAGRRDRRPPWRILFSRTWLNQNQVEIARI